jgi:diguanylate cyclase (GGDEF)-like protein/PAS domain S-box-containing protein
MSTSLILDASLEFALSAPPCLIAALGHTREILGFDASDLLAGQPSFLDRIHPDDSDIVTRLFSSYTDDLGGNVCLRMRHADGQIRCLQADFHRTAGRLHLHLQDAKSLSQHLGHEKLSDGGRALLDNTTQPIVFKDRNHVYTAVTEGFRKATSHLLNGRDAIGLTDYDYLPEADADQFYAAEKRNLYGEPEVHEIIRHKRTIWIELRTYPVKSPTGEIVGFYGMTVNLTRVLREEEQVYQANQALPESQKLAPIGTYILDVQRGAHATSASLDAMLGLPEDHPRDVAGWEALIHPCDRQMISDHFQQVIANPGRFFNHEYRIVRPSDGETRWIHGIGRVERDSQGRPLIMCGTLEDISERKATETALRDTKKRLELFIEHAPAALAMFDLNMCYLAVSRRWRGMYGVSRDIVGRSHYDVFPGLPERFREMHRRALAGESFNGSEEQLYRPDGLTIWTNWELIPWRNDDDSIGGLFLYAEDITDRKVAQERLKLAASVFAGASEAILVTDVTGNIVEVNDAFTRVTGYSREEAMGRPSQLLRSDRHGEDFYKELSRSIAETGRWRGEQWFRRKDGSSFEVSSTLTTVFDTAGKPAHYVVLFFDITPMREQERKLARAAHYDNLTGLPNRAFTSECLHNAIGAAGQTRQKVGLVFFDLDDFKRVNETHGRQAADSVLITVASRMKQVLGDGDTLGRIGGDEFLVVLPHLSCTEAAADAVDRLLHAASQPVVINGSEVVLSATAGATFYPQTEEVDADQMIRQAIQAMYEAKLAGKNRYFLFDQARNQDLRGRYEEIGRIRQALGADELVLHYQPKVDMSTGALVGTEALIRWQHPQHGLMLPGRFMPVVEEDDLSIEVGEWVIGSALCQIARWAAQGHRIPVSVNISPRHLQESNFVERLHALLRDHPAVDPSCLELEILESATVQDFEHASGVIEACLALGIKVSIDDFGVGYSSLTYLKRLPAPVIKIDQSFVRNMLEDPDDLALLQGVIGLANAFERTLVAEGVETVEQGVLLLKLGCAYAQGYGIARPMPASEIVPWFSNWWPDARWTQAARADRHDWPLLVAEVEHRAWGRELERYIAGTQPDPPELDESRCRFGAWLNAEKAGSRAGSPVLRQIEALHHSLHAAGSKAVALKHGGFVHEALSFTRSTVALSDRICAGLAELASS